MIRSYLRLAILLAAAGCGGGGSAGGGGAIPPVNPPPSGTPLPTPPVVVSHHGVAKLELAAVVNPATGLPAFEYDGHVGVAPTIRINPGDKIVIDLKNQLAGSGMASDMNLHFHGLTVSPKVPADDVLDMMAMPGGSLHYVVPVPRSQQPGLYWYHPHIHGEVDYQVGLAGMSGAIVVSGLTKLYPGLAKMKERIVIVRDVEDAAGSKATHRFKPLDGDQNNDPCGPDPGIHITLNGVVRPNIAIAPGERQFFRVVNATGHRNLVLQVDGSAMQVVASDGYPLKSYANGPPTLDTTRYVLPPAGRVEFVVTGPRAPSAFRTLCYNSGPRGDPDGPQILADLQPPNHRDENQSTQAGAAAGGVRSARYAPIVPPDAQVTRIVRLTEDSNGFYINGQAFDPNARPMFTVHAGTVEKWTILNLTEEVHDFHMHQVHFLVQSINGAPAPHPHWADSFVVPTRIPGPKGTFKPGAIEALVDFRPLVIRGTFVFHCHILDHEDGGMMAKIQAL